MRYIIVDSLNTFMRSRHAAHKSDTQWEKVGFALHVTLTSVNAVVRNQAADHVVFAIEGRSWRKDFYKPYKANRLVAKQALTEAEADDDRAYFDAYQAMIDMLHQRTNCSVIGCPIAEADDVIARFIQLHPGDEHIVVSTDTDFVQLLAENVSLYNGITDELTTLHSVIKGNGKPVIDKKTKQPKKPPEPQWALFEKCMRGDSTDNVFSAYPNVRIKSSKNKTGLLEAFEDRDRKGYAWNNLMLQRWTDHNDEEKRVIEEYQRNVKLIDLTAQPVEVIAALDEAIRTQVTREIRPQSGLYFMKFCGKYELNKLADNAVTVSKWLSRPYPGTLTAGVVK